MTAAPAMTGGMMGKSQTSTLNMMPGGGPQGSEDNTTQPPEYKSAEWRFPRLQGRA